MTYLNIESIAKPTKHAHGVLIIFFTVCIIFLTSYALGGDSMQPWYWTALVTILMLITLFKPLYTHRKNLKTVENNYFDYLKQLSKYELEQLQTWRKLSSSSRKLLEIHIQSKVEGKLDV